MRYVMSFLHQVMQDYLAYSHWREQELAAQTSLLVALRKRGLERSFTTISHKAGKLLQQHPFRDGSFYYHSSKYYEEVYSFSTIKSRRQSEGFADWTQECTIYLMLQQLQQACVALSHQTVLEHTYKLPLLSAVLAELQSGAYEAYPTLMLYYQLYQSLKGELPGDHFENLQMRIAETASFFSKAELKSIYLLALNHCIQQLNQGKRAYLLHAFGLYQKGLTAEIFLENGHLSRFTYNNIALTGMGLKEFDWTEHFLKQYRIHIEEQHRESTFNFNLATLYYRKKDYAKAMNLLRETEFKDVFHGLEARKMLLVIYFELEEVVALQSLLDSFKNLVYRQKNIGYHRENYLNLIRFTRRLLKYTRANTSGLEKLTATLQASNKVAEREWLMEKIEALR